MSSVFSSNDIALIRGQFMEAAALASRFLPVEGTVATCYRQQVSPLWGIGACAPGPHDISLFFQPEHFHLRTDANNGRVRYSATINHELHHNARWRGPGYGTTLGEMLVSEGLAMMFERETGHFISPSGRVPLDYELRSMAERAKPLVHRVMPDWPKPLDPELASIDRHTLGLAVVAGWSHFSSITAAKACHVPADHILRPWLEGRFPIVATPRLG